jgi:hypothetical protein
MKQAPFEQNIIAMVWDCDKTLISSYMQEPLFRYYGVDGKIFWDEVNALRERYAAQGISVNSDTSYLNNILTYVKAGLFKGLNNARLREFGKELVFYPGLPQFFGDMKKLIAEDPKYKAFDIRLEHYVVSTGFAETIRGSAIAPYVDGIYGCEAAAQHYFGHSAKDLSRREAAQLAATLPSPLMRNPAHKTPFFRRYTSVIQGRMGWGRVDIEMPKEKRLKKYKNQETLWDFIKWYFKN